ncbi:MAG: glycosyltransferase family 4 protein [Patescibacteria group bacterium]|nr:glycosyltransferase family 4 protein [Patescibacteria group bacterium]
MDQRLLFVTQTVDRQDGVLGFVVRWLEEFVAQNVKLTVFARILKKEDLPPDVRGIEIGKPKIRRILKLWWYSIKYRQEYDSVLVHMTPEILVLGWPVWFLLRKKVYLWYIHPKVSRWLKIGSLLCQKIFTATENSISLQTSKKTVVGHGIDTEVFKPVIEDKNQPVVLYVGRISPIKHVESLVEFLGKYHQTYPSDNWIFSLVGSYRGHEDYFESIKKRAAELGIGDRMIQHEPVEHSLLPEVFSAACVSLHATPTGSLDKVVLESLACGTPVIAVGKDYLALRGVMDMNNPRSLEDLHALLMNPKIDIEARQGIIDKHDLKRLISVLVPNLSK